MSSQAAFIIGPDGQVTIEGLNASELEDLLGPSAEVNCGRPALGPRPLSPDGRLSEKPTIRVHRIYHGSVVDGPGVRSVLQVQGCPIRCKGCYVPETHDDAGGGELEWYEALDRLLDPLELRDGITILGGEPMAQAASLGPVALGIVARGLHLTVYTGYTVERIIRQGTVPQRWLLELADLVIDGPYVESLSKGAGEYRGSSNQRLLTRKEMRPKWALRR